MIDREHDLPITKQETIKVTDLFRHIDYCDVTLQDKPSEARFDSYIEFGKSAAGAIR